MDNFQTCCMQKIRELSALVEEAEDYLISAPTGRLRVSSSQNSVQFYHRCSSQDTKGKYLRKSELKTAKELAQKEYALEFIMIAKKQITMLKETLDAYQPDQLSYLYERTPVIRQQLITPYVLPDDIFTKEWMDRKESFRLAHSHDDLAAVEKDELVFTEKGEPVRSKSEKILADKLYQYNVPYLYEVPLYLNNFGYIKPDFTLLNIRTRREIYWEHLGLMDDPSYSEKAIKKIECYERSGIFVGEQLILTFETRKHPINMKSVELLIQKYLL